MAKHPYDQSIFDTNPAAKPQGPVECFGMTFENDEKRREYFLDKLRENLKDPEFRKIEGFPIGSDEDILALSDPPYYTACPNPFIGDFIKHYGKPYDPSKPYSRKPFAVDVSEGKNDPIYTFHSYHTKVPYKAIMKYILHYTEPGDIIFDGFGGTGMTSIAAQSCADSQLVKSLGFSNPGSRRPITSDLSTISGFISGTLNSAVIDEHEISNFELLLRELEEKFGWIYDTCRPEDGKQARIDYVVWSESYVCDNCGSELLYYRDTIGKSGVSLGSDLQCPKCKVIVPKRSLKRSFVSTFDPILNEVKRQVKYIPTLIKFSTGSKRGEKNLDPFDEEVMAKVDDYPIGHWFPAEAIPKIERYFKDGLHIINVTHTHQFYTKRNLLCIAALWSSLTNNMQRLIFSSFCDRHVVKRNRWLLTGPTRPLNNTLYFPPLFAEVNVFSIAKRKIRDLRKALSVIRKQPRVVVSTTQSSTDISQIQDCSVDYIFTDPPFG